MVKKKIERDRAQELKGREEGREQWARPRLSLLSARSFLVVSDSSRARGLPPSPPSFSTGGLGERLGYNGIKVLCPRCGTYIYIYI
jgi:hypothetical protein